jgi:cell division protein FtsN
MENRAPASGLELILDNRKLIVAFALLITICGCFFVLGFIEGKRQGAQEAARIAVPPTGGEAREAKAPEGGSGSKPAEERAAKEQLDWYKSVNGRADAGSKGLDKTAGAPAKGAAPPKPEGDVAVSGASRSAAAEQNRPPEVKTTYSVQVGAFRQREQAEAKVKMLKSKGYDQCFIEPPASDQQLFLLKVGKFESRAEAVSMRLRLKKDGITSFIKAN